MASKCGVLPIVANCITVGWRAILRASQDNIPPCNEQPPWAHCLSFRAVFSLACNLWDKCSEQDIPISPFPLPLCSIAELFRRRYATRQYYGAPGAIAAADAAEQRRHLQYLKFPLRKTAVQSNGYAVVPSEDSHQSEYIAGCDARREFICGFTGSAGTAVVTHDTASLATDGRYFNQAGKQLDGNWELLKQGMQDVPTWQEWTAAQSEGGKTVGVDPTAITAPEARKLAEKIKKKGGAELKAVRQNLVDEIWGDKPTRPNEKVKVLGLEFSGKKFQDKIEDLRKELAKKNSAGMVVSMLDEVAWLFNLRGSDIPYNPIFFSYAVITPTTATLYVDDKKLSPEVKLHLGDAVTIRPYDAIFEEIESMSNETSQNGAPTKSENPDSAAKSKKFLISTKASWALSQSLGGQEKVDELRSPVGDAKAIKNDIEVDGVRQCHIRDGAALIEYFAWLEDQLIKKQVTLDEVDGADKLEEIRSKHQYFAGLSFDTISSTGANAAVIHYKPEKGECSIIDPKAIYLCDSGAQYQDGTTDTTRTLHFGEPTELEIKAYTLVLKGMIALELMKFPKGVSGFALDMAARQFLWADGLDYRHGTGHGVGSFLVRLFLFSPFYC